MLVVAKKSTVDAIDDGISGQIESILPAPMKSVKIPIEKDLRELPLHARLRDSQIMQAILMTHHQLGIHKPGSQPMCPMCQDSEIKTITIENN